MNSKFTKKSQRALDLSLSLAREMGHTYVGSEHLLLGVLSVEDSVGFRILSSSGVEYAAVRQLIISTQGSGSPSNTQASDMTPMLKRIIEESAATAARLCHSSIGTEHILWAMVNEGDSFAFKTIKSAGGSMGDIKNELSRLFGMSTASTGTQSSKRDSSKIPNCPTLSRFATDLCRCAREGKIDPIIGREEETERIIRILSRRTKNNPCLIGEPGVGKTAVVEGLCLGIANGTVPESLRHKTIASLDISAMVAGAKYRGEFEERMKNVMDEVLKNPGIILFVDEIHTLIGAGGAEGAMDAANIIKPALARGSLQMIGATTIDEYRKHIEKDAALERRFQSVTVKEPTGAQTIEILKGLREKYELHHGLKILDSAIEAAVTLSQRYIPDRFLPDKAIDLMDEAASKKRIMNATPSKEVLNMENEAKLMSRNKEEAIIDEDYEKAADFRDREKALLERAAEMKLCKKADDFANVGSEDIEDIVTAWTGIPVRTNLSKESERLLNLEKLLSERVIGQDKAATAIAKAVRRGRTGLKDPTRPVGSFIFIGPTGVGKTRMAKELSAIMFQSESALIRLDMSEYMEKHSVSKLIGSPPGYIGYGDGGQLTERVRRAPYSVVLFDEIEKAHSDVFNILLQILDEGVLTDSLGRKVDFKNTVIIMTSNAGAQSLLKSNPLGFLEKEEGGAGQSKAKDALKKVFSPEFLNRIDEIIVFNALTGADIRKIAALMLNDTSKRIGKSGIEIEFSDEVLDSIAAVGFDPQNGARPLKRTIVNKIEDSLAKEILSGKVQKGDRIIAKSIDEEIVYEKAN